MESGFNAMGKPVPANRLTAAYATVKDIYPDCETAVAMSIVGKAAQCVERDNPYGVIGAVQGLDPDLAKIDLTGRYRLLAVLLTEPTTTNN